MNFAHPKELRRELNHVVAGDGGGYDGGMEARIAKVEASVEDIQRRTGLVEQDIRGLRSDMSKDFRLTWGFAVAGFVAIGGMMVAGYFRIDERMVRAEASGVRLETEIGAINKRMDSLEAKTDTRFDQVDARFDKFDAKLDAILQRLPSPAH